MSSRLNPDVFTASVTCCTAANLLDQKLSTSDRRPFWRKVPAWHHLINRTQAQHLESVQKRAIHIIFNFTRGMSHPNVLFVAQLESLDIRRDNLSTSFFQDICKPTSCLHYFIPPHRDTSVTTRLRLTTSLPRPNLRTKKYCSLINFGLHHYQPT